MNQDEIVETQCGNDDTKESVVLASRLGRRARLLRIEAGLSQIEMAERLGICREMVARYERGAVCPRLSVVLRLCVLFAVPPERLLFGLLPASVRPLTHVRRRTSRRESAAARLESEGVRG